MSIASAPNPGAALAGRRDLVPIKCLYCGSVTLGIKIKQTCNRTCYWKLVSQRKRRARMLATHRGDT